MAGENAEWEREFLSIGYPIRKNIGVYDGWSCYEVDRRPVGFYGIAFKESERQAYVRFALPCPQPVPVDQYKSMFRKMRFLLDPQEEMKYAPDLRYEEQDQELVLKYNARVNSTDELAPALDFIVAKMDEAIKEFSA